MPEIGVELRDEVRRVIEDAGGIYLGIRNTSVEFRDLKSDRTASLYIFAVTRVNVELTLKNLREEVLTVPPLERAAGVY